MTPSREEYRTIPLTQGKVAIVDLADYAWLSQWKWHANWAGCGSHCYATRNCPGGVIRMHREILGLKPGDKRVADHIDGANTLDNRRSNLRIGTHAQNMQNRGMSRTNTSGFKGIHFRRDKNKFAALIRVNGARTHLGYRKTAEAAYHELYVPAVLKLHGAFARLQ